MTNFLTPVKLALSVSMAAITFGSSIAAANAGPDLCRELFSVNSLQVVGASPRQETAASRGRRVESTTQILSQYFSAEEFPNYFLSSRFREADFARMTRAERRAVLAEVAQTRVALEQAIGAIFSRVTIPIAGANGESIPVRLFPLLAQRIRAIDPTARVQPSGGVVRSALSLVYKELVEATVANSAQNRLAVLQSIARFEHPMFDAHGDISADRIRGVGSDFDILLDTQNPTLFQNVQREVSAVVNSATIAYMDQSNQNVLNKAIFSIGDIKPNFEYNGRPGQTQRSVVQGGTTLDFLLFDLQNQKLVEPPQHPRVVRDFILGLYTYAPQVGRRENHTATVLRGLRSLLELPFLRIKNEALLKLELGEMIKQARNGTYPNEKALEQIDKMYRNARMSGANNRLHRSPPEHPLSLFKELVVILRRAKAEGKLRTSQELAIPVYAREMPLNRSLSSLPTELRSFVMTASDFQNRYLVEGKLYHGTPTVEAALSIIRGGFRETIHETGLRRGTYFSPVRAVSEGYRQSRNASETFQSSGLLFSLTLRPGVRPNVIDLRNSPERVKTLIEQEAVENGLEMADLLAAKYGFDVIVLSNTHMLVKNTAILAPVAFSSLIRSIGESFVNASGESLREQVGRYLTYRGLYPYGRSMGIRDLPPIPSMTTFADTLYRSYNGRNAFELVLSFHDLEVAKALGETEKARFNEFVSQNLSWEQFQSEQLWPSEFSQVLTPEVFSGLFEKRIPTSGSREQISRYLSFIILATGKITPTPEIEAFVQRHFTPEVFQEIVQVSSYPPYIVSETLNTNLLQPHHIARMTQYYLERMQRAAQTGDSQMGFESLGLLNSINDWHQVLMPDEINLMNQWAASLTRQNKLEFWLQPKNIDWWSDSMRPLTDPVAEPILIYALRNSIALGHQRLGFVTGRAFDFTRWSPELRQAMNQALEAGLLPPWAVSRVKTHP